MSSCLHYVESEYCTVLHDIDITWAEQQLPTLTSTKSL